MFRRVFGNAQADWKIERGLQGSILEEKEEIEYEEQRQNTPVPETKVQAKKARVYAGGELEHCAEIEGCGQCREAEAAQEASLARGSWSSRYLGTDGSAFP